MKLVSAGGYPHPTIFHVLREEEWEAALLDGHYAGSTRGSTVAEVGFVHCCFAEQVEGVARRVYPGVSDVVVLVIDPRSVASDIRVEQTDGANEAFPHLYGHLDMAAVVDVVPLGRVPGS